MVSLFKNLQALDFVINCKIPTLVSYKKIYVFVFLSLLQFLLVLVESIYFCHLSHRFFNETGSLWIHP